MRAIFRYSVTAIAGVLTILFAFTIETVASAVGYTDWVARLVHGGVISVIESGYYGSIYFGAVFFGGATIALWADYLIREKDKEETHVNWGRIIYAYPEGKTYVLGIISDVSVNSISENEFGFRKITRFVISTSSRLSVLTSAAVYGDRKSLKWRIADIKSNFVIIDITISSFESDFTIEIYESKKKQEWKERMKWQSALPFKAIHYPHRSIANASTEKP